MSLAISYRPEGQVRQIQTQLLGVDTSYSELSHGMRFEMRMVYTGSLLQASNNAS